eukprot:GHVP01069279.1.p1 GENE.GHVP01069279.1~~GHVP01069279.1.p1  ORF type:complete len:106 (-),score=21.33 GHVP01069279.1:63-380(-)
MVILDPNQKPAALQQNPAPSSILKNTEDAVTRIKKTTVGLGIHLELKKFLKNSKKFKEEFKKKFGEEFEFLDANIKITRANQIFLQNSEDEPQLSPRFGEFRRIL